MPTSQNNTKHCKVCDKDLDRSAFRSARRMCWECEKAWHREYAKTDARAKATRQKTYAKLKADAARYTELLDRHKNYKKSSAVYKEYVKKENAARRSTAHGKLRSNISTLVWASLKRNRAVKGASWETMFGYNLEELKAHLENNFLPGMTWDNYGRGGWVVDHIRPVCSFRISSDSCPEFKACWALDNLRPLWEKDNQTKIAEDTKQSILQTV